VTGAATGANLAGMLTILEHIVGALLAALGKPSLPRLSVTSRAGTAIMCILHVQTRRSVEPWAAMFPVADRPRA